MPINYLKGDATKPVGDGNQVIAHVCNDSGFWGKGFVLAISSRWKEPEQKYRAWFKDRNHPSSGFALGAVRFVEVAHPAGSLFGGKLWIANMIGQESIKRTGTTPPIRYGAISIALHKVFEFAKKNDASIHMPKIGAGLAGGDWNIIEKMIDSLITEYEVPVSVYTLL